MLAAGKGIKIFAIALVLVLMINLTACQLLGTEFSSSSESTTEPSNEHLFAGPVTCYTEPSYRSDVAATFTDSVTLDIDDTITIEGVCWYHTAYGWIADDVTSNPDATITEVVGFVTGVQLRVRTGPGAENEKVGELPTGTRVILTQFHEAPDGTWGKTNLGWISMEHVYIPGTVTERSGFVVSRKAVSVYDSILEPREAVASLVVGDRLAIKHYITFTGDERWGYTEQGWIDLRDFYIEGEQGRNPRSGIVQDTTPLNIRTGPGIGYEIIGTLENGTPVRAIEQIVCTYDTWGFIGNGWIAMSRVVDQIYEYTVPYVQP